MQLGRFGHRAPSLKKSRIVKVDELQGCNYYAKNLQNASNFLAMTNGSDLVRREVSISRFDDYRTRNRDLDGALFGAGTKSIPRCAIFSSAQTGGRRPIKRPTRNSTKKTTNKIHAI